MSVTGFHHPLKLTTNAPAGPKWFLFLCDSIVHEAFKQSDAMTPEEKMLRHLRQNFGDVKSAATKLPTYFEIEAP